MTDAIEEKFTTDDGEDFIASSFLDYLRKSQSHWWNSEDDNWVFRGHSNAAWELVPTAGRPLAQNKLSQLIKQILAQIDTVPEYADREAPERTQLAYILAHHKALRSFSTVGRNLGFPFTKLPEVDVSPSSIGPYIIGHPVANLFDQPVWGTQLQDDGFVAIAQHHGIPTFQLDWTKNSVTAGFFATDSWESGEDIAVWALNLKARHLLGQNHSWKNSQIPLLGRENSWINSRIPLIAKTVPGNNIYIEKQSGVLTGNRGIGVEWQKNDKYPSLEYLIGQLNQRLPDDSIQIKEALDQAGAFPILRKLVLKAKEVPAFKKLLWREGVSKAHLMPTLDNVAATALSDLI